MMRSDDSDRAHEAQEAIERLIAEFGDVFAPELDMPVLSDWCIIVAHDSAVDPTEGRLYRLNRRHQWSYRSIGMLQSALDDARRIVVEDS